MPKIELPDFDNELSEINSLINLNTMPNSTDCEAQAIGALLVSENDACVLVPQLSEDHFYNPALKFIFSKIKKSFETYNTCDIVTVSSFLTEEEKPKIGGRSFLNEVSLAYTPFMPAESLFKQLDEHKQKRDLITIVYDILQDAYFSEPPLKTLEKIQNACLDVKKDNALEHYTPVRLSEKATETAMSSLQNGGKLLGISTGYKQLDCLTGGLQKGHNVILAARPSVGKTTLALQIALNASINQKSQVMLFSLEMNVNTLMNRLFTIIAGDCFKFTDEQTELTPQQKERLAEIEEYLYHGGLWVSEKFNTTIDDIHTAIVKRNMTLKKEGKPPVSLVIIDFLQLINSTSKNTNANERVSEISRKIKIMANELNVCMLTLSQLNRGVESREDKRPLTSDLRDSGSIEQDADMVMMLYREGLYKKNEFGDPIHNQAEIIIRKNRHGRLGTQNALFDSFGRFISKVL
jgi:replicative DNA helicase